MPTEVLLCMQTGVINQISMGWTWVQGMHTPADCMWVAGGPYTRLAVLQSWHNPVACQRKRVRLVNSICTHPVHRHSTRASPKEETIASKTNPIVQWHWMDTHQTKNLLYTPMPMVITQAIQYHWILQLQWCIAPLCITTLLILPCLDSCAC